QVAGDLDQYPSQLPAIKQDIVRPFQPHVAEADGLKALYQHQPDQQTETFQLLRPFGEGRRDRQIYVLRIGTHPGPAPPALARSLLLGDAYPNAPARSGPCQDRKSTRLNSSHVK